MKNLVIYLFITGTIIPSSLKAQTYQDSALIREAALNYMEGWYSGNADRMAKALSADLAKRTIRIIDTVSKVQYVSSTTMDAMIKQTAAGSGKGMRGANRKIDYELLDSQGQLAMVRLLTEDFIDYLQLGKINGEWKIINVLWTNKKK